MALSDQEELELLRLKKSKAQSAKTSEPKEPGFGEKAKAFGYGAATGFVGGPGELEEFGAYTLPEMVGLREKEEPKVSPVFGKLKDGTTRPTVFPTVKEAQKGLSKLGIEKPREEVSGYQTAGEILGGFGTALPRLARAGVKTLIGTPSKTSEAYAKSAEELGFKLSPTQVRKGEPLPSKGATGWSEENQVLANKLASKGTGKEVSEINPDFIRGQLKTLGNEFDKLYKGKIFNIDQSAVQALDALRNAEQLLPGSVQIPAIKSTANTIVNNFSSLASRPGAKPNTFAIEGDALQKIRNDLSAAARSTANRGDAHRIYELIDIIDDSVSRNHPNIAKKLSEIRPQYRNTVILEDLTRKGGIRQGNISLEDLGNMLGQKRSGVRSGTATDIDELGELGRELRLRALWQKQGMDTATTDVLGRVLGTTMGGAATGLGLRSRAARAAQRAYGATESPAAVAAERALSVPAMGTVTRPFND
ncbi:UNVERIFIED_CONTAM: hypothetical protein [Bacteriophage sp.]